jgi:hypothetical protein
VSVDAEDTIERLARYAGGPQEWAVVPSDLLWDAVRLLLLQGPATKTWEVHLTEFDRQALFDALDHL